MPSHAVRSFSCEKRLKNGGFVECEEPIEHVRAAPKSLTDFLRIDDVAAARHRLPCCIGELVAMPGSEMSLRRPAIGIDGSDHK
jgi:hypothetical protein